MRRCLPPLLRLSFAISGTGRTIISPGSARNMSSTIEAREAKRAVRKEIKARLSTLSSEAVAAQSRIAQDIVKSLPQYQQATRLGIYLSMPNAEAQTDLLVRDALETGKSVFVPYLYSIVDPQAKSGKAKAMDMLRLRSVADYEALGRDSWGIPSLSHISVAERENAMAGCGISLDADSAKGKGDDEGGLDLIVVPGVAFDAEMGRLGHGAGFYDKFLDRLRDGGWRKKPFLVGLCLAEQALPNGQILMQEHDWRVDTVAVGDGRLLRPEHAS